MISARCSVPLQLLQLAAESLTHRFIDQYRAGQRPDLEEARSYLKHLGRNPSNGWQAEQIVRVALARAGRHVLGIETEQTGASALHDRAGRSELGGPMRCA